MYLIISLYLRNVRIDKKIMLNAIGKIMSKLMNKNFLVKIGRLLYGYSGACRLLGKEYFDHLLVKALRIKMDKIVFRVSRLNVNVAFYLK